MSCAERLTAILLLVLALVLLPLRTLVFLGWLGHGRLGVWLFDTHAFVICPLAASICCVNQRTAVLVLPLALVLLPLLTSFGVLRLVWFGLVRLGFLRFVDTFAFVIWLSAPLIGKQ